MIAKIVIMTRGSRIVCKNISRTFLCRIGRLGIQRKNVSGRAFLTHYIHDTSLADLQWVLSGALTPRVLDELPETQSGQLKAWEIRTLEEEKNSVGNEP